MNIKTLRSVACLLCLIFLLNGCALVFSSPRELVVFDSDPEEAEVSINGLRRGTTPFECELDTSTTYTVEFRLEGYASKYETISHSLDGVYVFLDIIPGLLLGAIPIIIDAVTGSWYSLDKNHVYAELYKK